MLGPLLTLLVLGILGIVALTVIVSIVGAIIGMTFGLLGFLLFKVAPVLLIGWGVMKLIERSRSRRRISPADQKWLDS